MRILNEDPEKFSIQTESGHTAYRDDVDNETKEIEREIKDEYDDDWL
jgi:hypothetical protein